MATVTDTWTRDDETIAAAEGWNLWECSGRGLQIHRHDDPESADGYAFAVPALANDADAWRLVLAGAGRGSATHLKALRMVPPAEIAAIERVLGAAAFITGPGSEEG